MVSSRRIVRAIDPEISALTRQVRTLVSQAYRLSKDIDTTVDELREYVASSQRKTEED